MIGLSAETSVIFANRAALVADFNKASFRGSQATTWVTWSRGEACNQPRGPRCINEAFSSLRVRPLHQGLAHKTEPSRLAVFPPVD
jgi:hypothetical protein